MNAKLVSSIHAASLSRLITVPSDTLLRDVAKLLSDTHISLVVVCDDDGVMAGIITKTNIVKQIGHCVGSACTAAASQVMTRDVSFCHPDDGLTDVLSMMANRGFVHVPVVNGQSRPLGVVNARDALQALLADEQYEESLLRDYVMGIGYR